MTELVFSKEELINLSNSLKKEILLTNGAGGFLNSTLILCNTRKYHGMLIIPLKQFDNKPHLLLSSVDETILQHGQSFYLAIHKYPGIAVYQPHGHKYITSFVNNPIPTITYSVGGVVLKKELLLVDQKEQLLIRYTLVECDSETTLRIQPFLAFRDIHKLSKANIDANVKSIKIKNGIKSRLYQPFPWLNMQFSKDVEFIPAPDWYHNIEYIEELNRGYDYQEDLFEPGFFEITIKKGESVIFSASTSEEDVDMLHSVFESQINKYPVNLDFIGLLENSAKQFFAKDGESKNIVAGYPWFGRWGRDTFISLPGLTLSQGDLRSCKMVLDTMSKELQNGLFPNIGESSNASFNSVDAPLWYFWAVQMYSDSLKDNSIIWKDYGVNLKAILNGYRKGLDFNIKMHSNGLVWQGQEGKALTWMDAVVDGVPVTSRTGYAVEINALWYNAVCFTLQLACEFKDLEFISEWEGIPERIKEFFSDTFWYDKGGYLFDCVNNNVIDKSVRPNQIFAVSLPYSVVTDFQKAGVLAIVEKELLTPKGLRTLSPYSPTYKGKYQGNQKERDQAYHQGTVWPWLLGHFVEGYIKVHGINSLPLVENVIKNFYNDVAEYGLSTIGEIFDGDPPHKPRGTISQAWSVAEILRINKMIELLRSKNHKLMFKTNLL